MSHKVNIIRIGAVYNALGKLANEVVFVGGAVVSLYAEREAAEVRPTDDVDVLVEIYTHQEFSKLEERLRSVGFISDMNTGFVGRFIINGITVDIMPLAESVSGFPNRWYKEAYHNAIPIKIDERTTVKIFTAPYFLATKLEAFKNRGKNKSGLYDGRLSTDFEDIVYLLVYRRKIWKEISELNGLIKEYLLEEFTQLLQNPNLEEWIDAHTGYASPAAHYLIIPQIEELLNERTI